MKDWQAILFIIGCGVAAASILLVACILLDRRARKSGRPRIDSMLDGPHRRRRR